MPDTRAIRYVYYLNESWCYCFVVVCILQLAIKMNHWSELQIRKGKIFDLCEWPMRCSSHLSPSLVLMLLFMNFEGTLKMHSQVVEISGTSRWEVKLRFELSQVAACYLDKQRNVWPHKINLRILGWFSKLPNWVRTRASTLTNIRPFASIELWGHWASNLSYFLALFWIVMSDNCGYWHDKHKILALISTIRNRQTWSHLRVTLFIRPRSFS